MKKINDLICSAVDRLFMTEVDTELRQPEPEYGDYASSVALRLAKQLGRSPRGIAQLIADELKKDSAVASVEVAGPGFINIRVHSRFLVQSIQAEQENAPQNMFGANTSGKGETVVCEFPSPNMAKPYSVGHIRPALQGWAIAQVMRLSGYTVITDNHLGDSGTAFGKWVVGFLAYSSDEKLAEGGINELARVYILLTQKLKEEVAADKSDTADAVQEWLKKLESGDSEAVAYSKRFNDISLEHMHHVMDRLNISTEFEYGESYFIQRGQELADELLASGVAEVSKDAVVVSLDEYGIKTPIMLRKTNGTALYATTDLATVEFREKNWQPSKVFIHTGQEQAFYFKQLKALSQKAGYNDVINHIWHGLVDQTNEDGTRSKMSSRKGVVLLNDLLDEAEKHVAKISPEADPEDTRAIAMGAIKFADFMADRKKGSLFDWNTIFNTQGFSGPAVQYAAVRIGSILAKSGIDTDNLEPSETYDWSAEHALLLEVSAFPALIENLSKNYELHRLAAYLYQLARTLNRYYEKTPILKSASDELQSRLWLLALTKLVFETGLDVLGISVPKKM